MARSTQTAIERKHCSLASSHNYILRFTPAIRQSFSTFLLCVIFVEIINVDKIINESFLVNVVNVYYIYELARLLFPPCKCQNNFSGVRLREW